jgi:hypothetical protein
LNIIERASAESITSQGNGGNAHLLHRWLFCLIGYSNPARYQLTSKIPGKRSDAVFGY